MSITTYPNKILTETKCRTGFNIENNYIIDKQITKIRKSTEAFFSHFRFVAKWVP